jgi:hypothetical protein
MAQGTFSTGTVRRTETKRQRDAPGTLGQVVLDQQLLTEEQEKKKQKIARYKCWG